MHELTKMDANIFTVKMLDVILPAKSKEQLESFHDLFIVMTLVEHTLFSLFDQIAQVDFTEQHLLCILYNTLCCMHFLETANVLHRDLRPQNLLVTKECGVIISDFEFARTLPIDPRKTSGRVHKSEQSSLTLISENNNQQDLRTESTRTWKSIFEKQKKMEQVKVPSRDLIPRDLSPHVYARWYRPPEVILGQRDYSFSSDIWNIGCTMAECAKLTDKYHRKG